MSRKRLGRYIVPIFLPHQGCPHRCIFCEQTHITGRPARPVAAGQVVTVLEEALASRSFPRGAAQAEVAFYGGTFTRLAPNVMAELLGAAAPFIAAGHFAGIRISTRPDALDAERLDLLRRFGVKTVELGAQSMDDGVLSTANRGHTATDTRRAFGLLRRCGFEVGLQLMPGLPGEDAAAFTATIDAVLELHPDMVRLYPAIVIEGTEMAAWHRAGRYRPPGLQEAVELCAWACRRLENEGIPVIRLGLMSSPALLEPGRILAGPWHPAFGFLVRSFIHRADLLGRLAALPAGSTLELRAPAQDIPLIRGHHNEGLDWLMQQTGSRIKAVLSDDHLPAGEVEVIIL